MTGTARATSIDTPVTEVQLPDLVRIQQGTIDAWRPVVGSGVSVVLTPTGRGLSVEAATNATNDRISRIHLRWRRPCPPGALILGDAWERTYGDQQWTGLRPERVLPWMVLVHDPAAETTWGRASRFVAGRSRAGRSTPKGCRCGSTYAAAAGPYACVRGRCPRRWCGSLPRQRARSPSKACWPASCAEIRCPPAHWSGPTTCLLYTSDAAAE